MIRHKHCQLYKKCLDFTRAIRDLLIEKPFDANKLYNQIVHYYIDKKGLAKEQANDIAERVVKRERERRICQNPSCGHFDSKHIRSEEQCLVFECNCKNFLKI